MIKSRVRPPPVFSAYPVNLPGSIFFSQIDDDDSCLSQGLVDMSILAPKGITGPANGEPNLLSDGDFLPVCLVVSNRTEVCQPFF